MSDFECGICGFMGSERESMQHMDSEHAVRPVYECGHCGFLFWKNVDLETHLESMHTAAGGIAARECIQCGDLFSSATDLNQHLRDVHAPLQPIMCRYCGMLYRGGDQVEAHVHEHHASVVYLHCSQNDQATGDMKCTAFFMTSSALDDHVRLVHDGKEDEVGVMEGTNSGAGSRKACGEKSVEAIESPAQADRDRQMSEEFPDAAFVDDACRRKFSAINSKPKARLECVVCGLFHSTLAGLSEHVNSLHRTTAAPRVRLLPEDPLAANLQSSVLPDKKFYAVPKDGTPRKKLNRYRWSTELHESFIVFLEAHGLNDIALREFQKHQAPSRSMASLKSRAHQFGYRASSKQGR